MFASRRAAMLGLGGASWVDWDATQDSATKTLGLMNNTLFKNGSLMWLSGNVYLFAYQRDEYTLRIYPLSFNPSTEVLTKGTGVDISVSATKAHDGSPKLFRLSDTYFVCFYDQRDASVQRHHFDTVYYTPGTDALTKDRSGQVIDGTTKGYSGPEAGCSRIPGTNKFICTWTDASTAELLCARIVDLSNPSSPSLGPEYQGTGIGQNMIWTGVVAVNAGQAIITYLTTLSGIFGRRFHGCLFNAGTKTITSISGASSSDRDAVGGKVMGFRASNQSAAFVYVASGGARHAGWRITGGSSAITQTGTATTILDQNSDWGGNWIRENALEVLLFERDTDADLYAQRLKLNTDGSIRSSDATRIEVIDNETIRPNCYERNVVPVYRDNTRGLLVFNRDGWDNEDNLYYRVIKNG